MWLMFSETVYAKFCRSLRAPGRPYFQGPGHCNEAQVKFYLSTQCPLYKGIFGSKICVTGEFDQHAQHQQPCLASRTPHLAVRQKQTGLSGKHWSSFVHHQMSVVFCSQRFQMKPEDATRTQEDATVKTLLLPVDWGVLVSPDWGYTSAGS